MSKPVHAMAHAGFNVGNDLYDRARPSYPSESLSLIRDSVKTNGPLNILEIGAGTGLFTRALLAHPAWASSVGALKAVEPSQGMRDTFSKLVKDERVTVQEGTFDSTGAEDGWADLLVIAQALHWCPDFNAASAEFARVLKPGGVAIFIWNLEDRERAAWVAQLRDRIEQHEQGTPQFRLMLWRQIYDTPNYKSLFEPHEEKQFSYNLVATSDIVVERACSKSYIATLPEDKKQSVISDVKDILDEGQGREWIDKEKGIWAYPYKTYVLINRKKE